MPTITAAGVPPEAAPFGFLTVFRAFPARLAQKLKVRARWRLLCLWLTSCDVRGHAWSLFDGNHSRVWYRCDRCRVLSFGGTGQPGRFSCWRVRE